MKAFLYRACAIIFSHFVLYPDYRISFFIPLAFRFADYRLISDYSGIIFDFLLLDRPIILLPYDESEYISERNVNFDFELFEFINSPKDMNCFLNLLLEVTNNFSVPNKQRRFKDVVHYYTDNRSCERHYNEISKLIKFKYRLS